MGRSTHPIDRMPDARTFEDALQVAIEGHEYERRLCDTDPDITLGPEVEDAAIARLKAARDIYRRHRNTWEKDAVAELRREGMDDIADALESDDYDLLRF